MGGAFAVRVLVVLAVSLSLSGLPGVLSISSLPSIPGVRAAPAPFEPWYSAGPASNTLEVSIFAGAGPEAAGLFAAPPLIDAMDVSAPPAPPPPGGCAGSADYFLTASGYCYTSYWHRVIDGGTSTGTFNFFTPLNAYSTGACINPGCVLPVLPASPPLAVPSAGTFREGFSAATTGLNPYNAPVTVQNKYILNSVYDQLYRLNPMDASQLLDWMTLSSTTIVGPGLGYVPPAGTTVTIRNTLAPTIFWQDGTALDARDVVFTYLSLIAAGAAQLPSAMICPGPGCLVTGLTLLNPLYTQFDINLSGLASGTKQDLGSVTVLPGHIWSTCAAAWAGFKPATPAVFPLGAVGCVLANPVLTGPATDPITAINPITGSPGILIGSGPWSCQNTGANVVVSVGTVGTGCSSSNTQAPPAGGDFTLTRFGCTLAGGTSCIAPGSGLNAYFRSAGNLALYVWSGNSASFQNSFTNFSVMAACFGRPVGAPGCSHWQEGIGNQAVAGAPIGIIQAGILKRFFAINWVSPFDWTAVPPTLTSIGVYPPLLYERTSSPLVPAYTLAPAPGCVLAGNGGGAAAGYPGGGGYDC